MAPPNDQEELRRDLSLALTLSSLTRYVNTPYHHILYTPLTHAFITPSQHTPLSGQIRGTSRQPRGTATRSFLHVQHMAAQGTAARACQITYLTRRNRNPLSYSLLISRPSSTNPLSLSYLSY